MRPAVVRLPRLGIAQPVVGAEVDDLHVRRQLRGDRGRLAVRQGEEDQVGAGQAARVGGGEGQLEVDQMRVDGATGVPAWEWAVAAAISNSGCPASRRSSSPPAYPLAPATATRIPTAFTSRGSSNEYARHRITMHRLHATRRGDTCSAAVRLKGSESSS